METWNSRKDSIKRWQLIKGTWYYEVSANCHFVFSDYHVLRTCIVLIINVKTAKCLWFPASCSKPPVMSPGLLLLGASSILQVCYVRTGTVWQAFLPRMLHIRSRSYSPDHVKLSFCEYMYLQNKQMFCSRNRSRRPSSWLLYLKMSSEGQWELFFFSPTLSVNYILLKHSYVCRFIRKLNLDFCFLRRPPISHLPLLSVLYQGSSFTNKFLPLLL